MESTPFIIKRNDTLPALVVNVKTKADVGDNIPFQLTSFTGGLTTSTYSMIETDENIKIQK